MKNFAQMMKQAQDMQQKMQDIQDALADMEITGAAGGGMVEITLNGKGEGRRVRIDPSLTGDADTGVLEDLVVAAINDARGKVDALAREKMSELTGGIELPPGMQLPF